MRIIGVLVLLGLSGFLGYSIWKNSQEKSAVPVELNAEFIASSEEIITWKPVESALNPTELPHWKDVASEHKAYAMLERINTNLAELEVADNLKIRLFMNAGESVFYLEGGEEVVSELMKAYFGLAELAPDAIYQKGEEVGAFFKTKGIIASSENARANLLAKSTGESSFEIKLDEDSELSWYSKSNAKRWLAFNEIRADGSATIRFKKRKGYTYAYAFMNDSLMTNQSLDVTYSIWDFQLPGSVSSFSIEEFPIRELDQKTVSDVEEICQCDARVAWKSWNSNQVYLFRQNNIEFYGLQCLTDLPAQSGLYPFIADNAEMYKGYQLKSLISGSEVGGLYADMFGREVAYFLDLEEQVFFFSSISEAKTFINGIQNMEFNYLVDQNLRELLLLSPSYTAYNSEATGDIPVVYQFEKQDKGRYYHALWKSGNNEGETAELSSEPVQSQVTGAPKNTWERQMEAKVIGEPFLFTNHYTKAKEIAILTADNKISLLDSEGKLLWERQLSGEVLGAIHQVDLYRNNKFQLVFSTKNELYAIDRNGKNVENFPVTLKSEASAAVSVMDYDGNRKYRLLVPLADGSLLNIGKDGKPVNGWKHKAESSPIISQIIHTQVGRKDYLISAKENGKIAIYKRDGKLRYTQELKLSNYNGSAISMISSKDIENVNLVYKDANNNIVKVKLSLDNNESEIIGVASGEHVLIAAMVDDKAPDYLVSKGGRLSLYNEANEVKFTAEFDESIESALQYFSRGKSGYLGFSSGNNYYVTNLRGELLEGFPLYGSGKALFTDLNKDGSTELVTSDPQGLVVCYELGL